MASKKPDKSKKASKKTAEKKSKWQIIKSSFVTIHHTVWGKGKKKFFIAILVTLAIFFTLLVIGLEVTSKPWFCNKCHYMKPYYENWKTSSHSDVTCVDCHFPPGLGSKIEGKFTALSMLVNYFTGVYKKSKPRAEIEDASCLRGGCHEERKLHGETGFKQHILFDHKPHLENLRRGKKLRCTSCHSQIVQGEHISVTEDTCFLCHFKKSDESETIDSCTKCHNAPVPMEGNDEPIAYDHTFALERKIACADCHGDMVMGDGLAPRNKCDNCHAELHKLKQYDDTDLMHKNHVTDHKIECRMCHTEIQHKSVSRTPDVKPGCAACHSDAHQAQLQLFMGRKGKQVPEHASIKFEAGLNCKSCHVTGAHKFGFELNGITTHADGKSCDTCHGAGYGNLLDKWKTQSNTRIMQVAEVLKKADNVYSANKNHRNASKAKKMIEDARFNYNFVKYGKAVHNLTYSNQLMSKSYELLSNAIKILDSTESIPFFDSPKTGGDCSKCHGDITRTVKQIYGLNFPHYKHVKEQKLQCSRCHSNKKKHGTILVKRSDCISCHHEDHTENCSSCHKVQEAVYTSKLDFSTLEMPNSMAADVSCVDCHVGEEQKIILPDEKSCSNCHDEDYEEFYFNWMEQTTDLFKMLERKIKTENLPKTHRAVRLLKFLQQDGSSGIHNPDLYERLIEEALK